MHRGSGRARCVVAALVVVACRYLVRVPVRFVEGVENQHPALGAEAWIVGQVIEDLVVIVEVVVVPDHQAGIGRSEAPARFTQGAVVATGIADVTPLQVEVLAKSKVTVVSLPRRRVDPVGVAAFGIVGKECGCACNDLDVVYKGSRSTVPQSVMYQKRNVTFCPAKAPKSKVCVAGSGNSALCPLKPPIPAAQRSSGNPYNPPIRSSHERTRYWRWSG